MVSKTSQKKSHNNSFQSQDKVISDVEYREIDFSQAEDREIFFETVRNIYVESFEYLVKAKSDDFSKLELENISGEEIFNVLREKFNLLQKLASEEGVVSDNQVDEMQSVYNDMVILRNYILDAYVGEEKTIKSQANNAITKKSKDKTEIPSEREVNSLVERVYENQFLLNSEVEKVRELYELFMRLVAKAEFKQAIGTFTELKSLIYNFENKPEVEVISKRAIRILEHVYATHEIPGNILERATDLFEDVKEVELDLPIDNKKLLSAYKSLEQFARKHESDWLSVCGVRLPVSGPSGLKQVQRMHEVLLAERNSNSALVSDTDKQILIDELILKLSQASSGGLNAKKDIPEVVRLAHLIDVPLGQSQVIESPQDSNAYIAPKIKRKTMEIITDDIEKDIKIVVAEEAAKSIKVENKKTINHVLIDKNISKTETKVVSRAETVDPINKVIEEGAYSGSLDEVSFDDKNTVFKPYFKNQDLMKGVKAKYSSMTSFESKLETKVLQIESKTTDAFEKWLGESKKSVFEYLENMNLSEIFELADSSDRRSVLEQESIKYETFLNWVDLIPVMQEEIHSDEDLVFGELFVKWFILTDNSREAILS